MFEPDADLLNSIVSNSDLADTMAEFSDCINDSELGIEIDPYGIYCQKTGYQIATRDKNSLLQLIAICGKDNLTGNLYNATSLCVHPAWLCTNPDDLDNLIESDPVGYACFMFDMLTRNFYQNNLPKAQDTRRLSFTEKYWALARANKLMLTRGAPGLDELNIALARIVTFMPDSGHYLFTAIGKFAKTPDALANLHCNGELLQLLEHATNRTLDSIGYRRKYAAEYIKKTMFIDIAATPEDAARGPSNVRRQRVSKEKVEDATMFAELMKLAKDQGVSFNFSSQTSHGITILKSRMTRTADKEMEMLAQLTELAAISNVALPEIEEESEEDLSVEVRKVIILPVIEEPNGEAVANDSSQSQSAQSTQQIQSIPEQPKLSGLALFKARKAGLL